MNAFETTREKVRNSSSSIFSKSDVLQLLHDAEALQKEEGTYTLEEVHELADRIMYRLTRCVENEIIEECGDFGLGEGNKK
jgi:hypothetical protein